MIQNIVKKLVNFVLYKKINTDLNIRIVHTFNIKFSCIPKQNKLRSCTEIVYLNMVNLGYKY